MKKTVLSLHFGALATALAFGFWSQAKDLSGPPEQIIEFKGHSDRFLVFVYEELQVVKLCGLEEGDYYLLNVMPAFGDDGVQPSFLNLGPGGMSYGKIKAAGPCHTLVVKTVSKKEFFKLPVYISVSLASETYSVKPPAGGPGRPPAITTSTSTPLSELITDVLIGGDCFEVTNVTSGGTNNMRGTFSNGMTSIGISNGVILSSGNIATASGPNNSPSAGMDMGQYASDPDLAQIAGSNIRDVSKIEFNFKPTNDTVTFRYVFASEEYCEWINSGFNDVFGFFLSGPGINGPFTNNAINIAVLPNSTPVSIDNVNHVSNASFYVGNIPAGSPQLGDPQCAGHPIASGAPVQDCQFDGFTTVLTATAVVIPCSTYHIKLAVSDVGDGIYDSAVFLEANSFTAGTLAATSAVGTVPNTNIIYEGCTGGHFLFVRGGDLSEPLVITYTITGSATSGADYTPIATSITIPAGDSVFVLPINAILDGITEGAETITLNLNIPCQCSQKIVTMQIQDPPPLNLNLADQELCGGQSITLNPGVTGGVPGDLSYEWSNGATTPTITVSPPVGQTTTYSVTVTDECGNTATDQASITVGEIPTATLSGSGVLCAQGNTDPVEVTINFTGTAPWQFVYSLNGVQTTVTTSENPYILNISNPGTVSLVSVISTTGNCPGTVSGTATVTLTNLLATTQVNNPDCNGNSDGSITLTVGGNGTSPFTYSWSNGSTLQNPAGLPAGTYTVTVTDANGCTQTATATLTDPPLLTASVTGIQQVDCTHPTGSITTSVSGGTPGYTYQWSPSGSGANPAGLPAGTYTATITDANGCTVTVSGTVNENLTPPNAAASVTGILTCSVVNLTLSGAGSSTGPGFTYQWTGPGIVSGGNTLNPVVNAPGTYTLTVTNTANGCTETASVSVPQDITPPVATGTAPPITCNDPQVTISGAGSSTGPNFTYQWTGPGIVSGGNTLTPVVNQPGNYTLLVTNTVNGCTANTTVNVPNQTQLPTATATAPPITCANPSVSINGNGSSTGPNFTYIWTGPGIVSGGTTLNPVVNQPGAYTLTVTNTATGCQNSTTVNVALNTTPPVAEAGPPFQLDCGSPTVQLNGAGSSAGSGFTYQWSGPGIVSGGNTLTPVVGLPGTYTLTVTNSVNGCTANDQVIVTQDITAPIATVAPPPTITCAVPQVTLSGAGSSSGPNFSYNWTTVGGLIVSGGNTLNPVVGAGGMYTLVVTNTSNDCTASYAVVVPTNLVPPLANAGPEQELTCVVSMVQLIGAGSSVGPNYIYQWTTQNGNIVSGANTLYPIANAPGFYTLTVTNTFNGCTASSTTQVVVDEDVPFANAGQPQTITCVHPVVTLNGTGSSSGPNFTFLWTTTDGNIVSGAATPTPMVNLPGTYQLTVTSQANGCQSSSYVTVGQDIVLPDIVIQPAGEVNCFTPQVTIDATASSQGSMSYTWNTPDGNIVSGQGTLTLVVDQGGTYILTIVNTATGCLNGGGVTVPENVEEPVLVIAPAASVTCAAPQVAISTAGSSTGPEFQYTWTTSDGTIVSGADTPSPIVSSGGTYELVIYDQSNNCSSSGQVVVPEDTNLPTVAVATPQELNCTVQTVPLNATIGGGANLSFTWLTGDGNFVSGQNTLQPTVDQPGTYLIEVVNPATGCQSEQSIQVAQDIAIPQTLAGPDGLLTCAVTGLSLDGTASDTGPGLVYAWSTPDGNIVSGSNTLTPQIDEPGTYILEILNTGNTCQSADTVSVDEDITAPVAAAEEPILMGCLDPVITLDGSASSAGPDFVYSWTTPNGNILSGGDSQMPQVDAPGDYTLTVLNTFNDCFSTVQLTVVEDVELPVVDAGPGGELTCTVVNIQLQATVTGQTSRYEYLWTTAGGNLVSGQGTLDPVVNEPGLYTLIATDTVNGCTAQSAVEITQDVNVPTAEVEPSNPFNCYNPMVILDGTASSQGPSLVFSWSTPDGNFAGGTETLTPVVDMPGTYTLTINDTINFCLTSQTVQIIPDTAAPALAIAAPEQLTCYQPGISLSASAGGLADIDISWTTPDGNIVSGANTLSPQVDSPGLYVLEVTDTTNGCSATDQVTVTTGVLYPLVQVSAPGPLTCAVQTIQLDGTDSDAGPGFVYNWTTVAGNIISGADGPQPVVDLPGIYTLAVTNLNNGCVSSADAVAAIDTIPPEAEAGPQSMLTCAVQQLQLDGAGSSAGPFFSYQWTTTDGLILAGASTLSPAVGQPGTYELLVTNQVNGCSSADQVSVGQDLVPPLAVASSPGILTCAVPAITLSGSGSSTGPGFSFNWSTPDGNIVAGANTLAPQVDQPGQYALTVFNQINGCSASTSVGVQQNTVAPLADAGAAAELTCAVTSLALSGSASGNSPDLGFLWTTQNGNILSGAGTLTPVVNQPGQYVLSVTDLENGCSVTDQVFIGQDVQPPLNLIAAPEPLTCTRLTVGLDALGSDSGPDFPAQWTTSGGNIVSGAQTLNPVVDQPGQYTLTIINADNGCSTVKTVQVVQDTVAPVVDAGPDLTLPCFEDFAYLEGTVQAATSSLLFSWSTADGDIIAGGNTLTPAIGQGGTYLLLATNQFNGCQAGDEVQVKEDLPADPEFIPGQPPCYGDKGMIAILGVAGGTPPYVYSVDGGSTFQSHPVFSGLDAGVYTIVIQDALGCETQPEVQPIFAPDPVEVVLGGIIELDLGESYQLQALVNVPESEIQAVSWSPAEGLSCTDCLTPVATPLQTTTYRVEIATDKGCLGSALVQLVLDKRPAVYVPNIFSPNGDGENDFFYIFAKPEGIVEVKSFLVFSRWGETVYAYQHFQPNDPAYGWDGVYRGLPMDPAVFTWFAEIEFIDGRTELFEGSVTLVR